MRQLSRLERIAALGHTHVESDLPPKVRDWCVGESVLCLVEGEFQYMDRDVWKQLQPFKLERVLGRYRIFAGMDRARTRPQLLESRACLRLQRHNEKGRKEQSSKSIKALLR